VAPRAIFPVSSRALRAQLELIATSFEFVSRDQLLEAADGRRALPARACIITFDDGLRCQLQHALPVLERLGIPALFFVPGQPLAEGRVLATHKLQHIREQLSDQALTTELERAGVSVGDVDENVATAHYRYETADAARLKYLLNHLLPADRRHAVVDSVFSRVHGDEESLCSDLYLSRLEVRELERSHRAVGAHSYAHHPLALLPPGERKADLELSVGVLEQLTGERPRAFSYPHGTATAVDLECARAAESVGLRIGFTMERALNQTLAEPCLLGRLDANDVPGGSRPLLELVEGTPLVREGATAARRRYFDESAWSA